MNPALVVNRATEISSIQALTPALTPGAIVAIAAGIAWRQWWDSGGDDGDW